MVLQHLFKFGVIHFSGLLPCWDRDRGRRVITGYIAHRDVIRIAQITGARSKEDKHLKINILVHERIGPRNTAASLPTSRAVSPSTIRNSRLQKASLSHLPSNP